jgi:hypothetical protein
VKLEIQGNRYFDSATIRERMSVIPATFSVTARPLQPPGCWTAI